ncbi:hypothetical protein AYR62_16065 (plasmid) [Secundilactobacillus paracollinoides]|uniref:hypothetical protein n=1 Tax=Secundilactobacillus paracollinoides TaxID=240427 RepID=UPI00081A2F02|nr:hypothetical protein [Secundilactobacillus paracollinoides]ANZ65597.1 hypothetical protein AYR62_16065 [Secundilactobacillus paracollinoides]
MEVKIFKENNIEATFPVDLNKKVDSQIDRHRIQNGFSILKFLIEKYPDLVPDIKKEDEQK